MRLLEIDDLAVSFNTEFGYVRAVNGVTLDLSAGETLAIVGESGSGKSVTALSMLKLLGDAGRIEHGSILFAGEDLVGADEKRMRSIRGNQISMIFQEPMSSLNPVIPIGKQVAEPLVLHRGMDWPEALDQAAELLAKVAIPDARARLTDYPHQLSGGMRQRVMIAMAMSTRPQLIIADEPTTALDVTVQAQILELLKDLTRESGAAMILITHDLGVVARYAERVAVMYAGRVVETAPAKELYAAPIHPYTIGLLNSIPPLTGPITPRLAAIKGQPPNLASLPEGCPFAPRCPQADATCLAAPPPLEWPSANHGKRCYHA